MHRNGRQTEPVNRIQVKPIRTGRAVETGGKRAKRGCVTQDMVPKERTEQNRSKLKITSLTPKSLH